MTQRDAGKTNSEKTVQRRGFLVGGLIVLVQTGGFFPLGDFLEYRSQGAGTGRWILKKEDL